MKSPGCASFLVLSVLSVWVVKRWDAVGVAWILIATLAVTVGLLRVGWFDAYREDVCGWLPVMYALLAGSMGRALGLGVWEGLLLAGLSGTLAWFLVDQIRPIPEHTRRELD